MGIDVRNLRRSVFKSYMKLKCVFVPIKKNVMFSSFKGEQYSDNPRAISEKLHELYPDIGIYWYLITDKDGKYGSVPDYVHRCKSKKEFYKYVLSSFCFVTNTEIDNNIIKRKNQFFIQTWHGDTGMKKILLDSKRRKGKPVNDSKYTDLAISGSELSVNKYHTAFNYHGEILKMGTPRNDRLVCRDLAAETRLKCKLNIEENAKILLYAPTFRAGNGLQSVDVNINEVLKTLEDKYDQKWVCLIRAHSGSGGIDIECDGNRFISVSDYPDMSDLLAICDMLLTDYSSCAGDPIRVKKPVILAQFDKKEYISADRELYYDPEEAGFIVAYDQEQLINILKTYTVDDYNKSCEKIMAYFDIVESGKTSDEICKRINDFYCKTFCGEKSH